MSKDILRRQFLKAGVGFIAGAGGTTLFSNFSTVVLANPRFPPEVTLPPEQEDWRYCTKCQSMFFQGVEGSAYDRRRGVCAAGGVHEPAGYNFSLSYNVPETQNSQTNWRYCTKCQSMFFQGVQGSAYDRRRGVCAAGGVHEPAGYKFVLPHDVSEMQNSQANWRYCTKCQSMFFQGVQGSAYDRRRGVCAAGGVHEPAGYKFVLRWYDPPTRVK
jgi:hypothetical protein